MLKFQNYKKYKLPITINPLNYGKLIYQNINFYVMFINNKVKIYTNGELNFEYKDHKIDDSTFIRSIEDRKFTYENGQLIEVNKIIVQLILISLILLIILINIDNTSILI